MNVLDVGGNDGRFSKLRYPNCNIRILDKKEGWDILKFGLPYGDWDVILLNHVIEHIHDPDYVLDECKKVMSENTVLDIGIPNLSAWFNRIFFLFGYLPHSYELSYRYNLGKPFDWNKEEIGGHIRVFNVPSLLQLLKYHNLKVISVKGERSFFQCHLFIRFIDGVLTLNPNLASSARIICKK